MIAYAQGLLVLLTLALTYRVRLWALDLYRMETKPSDATSHTS